MTNLKNRLPEFQSAILVYSVIVFLVYGWTLTIFLWKVPSWIKFLTVGELMVILAYSMSAALLESLFVLGLLSLAGEPIPSGAEGQILPGLGGESNADRSVFSVEAKEASAFRSLNPVSLSMIKDGLKLTYYKGYEKYPDAYELYDLKDDRDERRNLYGQDKAGDARLKEELLDHFAQAERTLQHS